jgi:hypothetical protein
MDLAGGTVTNPPGLGINPSCHYLRYDNLAICLIFRWMPSGHVLSPNAARRHLAPADPEDDPRVKPECKAPFESGRGGDGVY